MSDPHVRTNTEAAAFGAIGGIAVGGAFSLTLRYDVPSIAGTARMGSIRQDPTLPRPVRPAHDIGDVVGVDYDCLPDNTQTLPLAKPSKFVGAMRGYMDAQGLL